MNIISLIASYSPTNPYLPIVLEETKKYTQEDIYGDAESSMSCFTP